MEHRGDSAQTLLAGKERADRSIYLSYYGVVAIVLAVLAVTLVSAQLSWSLPRHVSCDVIASDTVAGTATVADDAAADKQLKVWLKARNEASGGMWATIVHEAADKSGSKAAIVDAEAVTRCEDGTYMVSFVSPYDSYVVSSVFYLGEPQGLLDLL